ncbi:MAG: hypothetical protein KAT11_03045 [Phycisphaerae bacterium]|nr:hypothetical protein [Phycisphaerae bacterium]
MPEMMPQGSVEPVPDVTSFLLLVAVLALLVCTIYLVYLGCTSFGAHTFFRAIYSTSRIPEIAASAFAPL